MHSYRYLTCSALTGQVLAWDLPLSDVEYGPELNGPGSLTATLEPHLAHVLGSMVDPGNTMLFAERDSKLMWGGLIWRAEPEAGRYPIEAAGFTSYLGRRHDLHGNLNARGPYTYGDPCKLMRDVWAYCQEQPDGNLGVLVDATTSKAKIGTPEEPYASGWWETRTLADLIVDAVGADGGPEWTEQVEWAGDVPRRRFRIGWPRLGTRRTDVSFTTGVNIAVPEPVIYDGDTYAQVVVALGSGEGGRGCGRSTRSVTGAFASRKSWTCPRSRARTCWRRGPAPSGSPARYAATSRRSTSSTIPPPASARSRSATTCGCRSTTSGPITTDGRG